MSCGYQGHHFGAHYPDALCIDGYLWDLDSGDFNEGFSTGGEIPCPACKTAAYLDHLVETIQECFDPDTHQPAIFEHQLRQLVLLAPNEAIAAAAALPRHVFVQISPNTHELEVLEVRTWPWRIVGLSAHQNLEIMRAEANPPGRDLSQEP